MDYDPNSIPYARNLLEAESKIADCVKLHQSNAMQLVSSKFNIERFGYLTTIYSPGVFDYLPDQSVTTLLRGLYRSLAPKGLLIVPFKDSARYEIYDYHWLAKWDTFLQRTTDQVLSLVNRAEIPASQITVERDETGAIAFVLVRN